MTDVQYRFLPWTRRGLSAAIIDVDQGNNLAARGKFQVGMTVTNLATNPTVDLALYGPGDVLGIDPRLIVRCTPRAGTTNFESNYFAAIEFDPPDFPWMFTPAKANPNERLRPWLALVVLDRQYVELPKVEKLQPLPTITIPAEVSKGELPDLSESWAWAHTQVMTAEGDATPLADALQKDPDANISRLICPRHLKANRQYIACLVPAFDAGVNRGLGDTPDPSRPLGPAWDINTPGKVVLPVYYHWEFATGPLGDFESLARKLRPFRCPETVGQSPMYIGEGGPDLPFIPPDQPEGNTLMDGALRRKSGSSATFDSIAQILRDGLKDVLNAPSQQLASGPSDATPVLGPPLYGQWPARQFTINDSMPQWMHELNLDPRTRVAAGLGAEVVRKYQEDFMQKCWEQVGEILKANQRLNWGRLGLEANRRAFERHFKLLPKDRQMQISGPVQRRILVDQQTIPTKIQFSSAPDTLVDPAMRRTLSPQRPIYQKAVRRLMAQGRLDPAFRQSMRSGLVGQLSAGRLADQPTRFSPDGLVSTRLLPAIQAGQITEIAGVQVDIAKANDLQSRIQQLDLNSILQSPLSIEVRPDIAQTGMITQAQINDLVDLQTALDGNATTADLSQMTQTLLDISRQNPDAQGVLVVQKANSQPVFNPIFIGPGGKIRFKDTGGLHDIGELDPGTQVTPGELNQILRDLPPNTFDLSSNVIARLKRGTGGGWLINDNPILRRGGIRLRIPGVGVGPVGAGPLGGHLGGPPGPHIPPDPHRHFPPFPPPPVPPRPQPPSPVVTKTISLPYKDAATIQDFQAKVVQALNASGPILSRDVGQKVTLDLDAATAAIITTIDPVRAVTFRLAELVKVDGSSLAARIGLEAGLRVTPDLDRIMAYPDLPAPTYQYLAAYDKERFCPGIGVIPLNSITLLETNSRFIEAFMVGLNHEMNREMLWREYPTDQRGTPFRYFWAWVDGNPDLVKPIHQWNPGAPVGGNLRGAGLGGQIVMLVRGELVRRYPNAVMLAWKAALKNGRPVLKDPPAAGDLKTPVFQGRLDPDVIFAGFDLRDTDLEQGDGWFFLVQEQPTEPHFGFDQPDGSAAAPINRWQDASWLNVGVEEGQYILLASDPLTGASHNGLTFGKDSAHMASITLQQPMRVAVHSKYMQDLT